MWMHIEHIDDIEGVEVAPGVVRRSLYSSERLTAWVIDFAPGSEWPSVDEHANEERYVVLEGSIDEAAGTAHTGDYVSFGAGSSHRPRSSTGARILGHNLVL
jgi:anti-sigma factor ChrR (cupin superfamily)